jgi:pseudouridine synthase
VDGVPIPVHPELRHLALNKPAGVTTTLRDQHAERSLVGFLPRGPRVFPVGRLDRDSEGLLLLTNDGALAHRLQHPRFGVEKEYLVEVEGQVSREALRRLTAGVDLEDGPARAVRAVVSDRGSGRSALAIVMREGRKREIRRMLAAVGYPVRRLVRTRVGPVLLRDLAPASLRPLSVAEISELYRLTGLSRAQPGAVRRDRSG